MERSIDERTASAQGLLVTLPQVEGEALYWWRIDEQGEFTSGCDVDVATASEFDFALPDQSIVALVSAGRCPISMVERPDLPEKQALALAARKECEAALGGLEANHCVASTRFGGDARLSCAKVDKATLSNGLRLLSDQGIDPHHVVPAAVLPLLARTEDDEAVEMEVGGEAIAADKDLAIPYDKDLTDLLLDGRSVRRCEQAEVYAALHVALAEAPLDLLTGAFARKRRRVAINPTQWKTLLWLTLAIAVVTLLIGLATWFIYSDAATDTDAQSLAKIEKVLGDQPDLPAAEAALDQALADKGYGSAAFSAPVSALYKAMQPVPQVTVRQMQYLQDGTLSASLSAPDANPVNQVLADLQRSGFTVTANSRVEQNGQNVFDITVRGF